jgi:hypothetical protein
MAGKVKARRHERGKILLGLFDKIATVRTAYTFPDLKSPASTGCRAFELATI